MMMMNTNDKLHCFSLHLTVNWNQWTKPGQTTKSSIKSCSNCLQCRSSSVTSSDVLYSLHWLPVRRRIEFKTVTLCFKAVRLGNPPYLKNMLKPYEPLRSLRSFTMDLLTVPRTDSLHLVSVAFLWLDHESGMDILWEDLSQVPAYVGFYGVVLTLDFGSYAAWSGTRTYAYYRPIAQQDNGPYAIILQRPLLIDCSALSKNM